MSIKLNMNFRRDSITAKIENVHGTVNRGGTVASKDIATGLLSGRTVSIDVLKRCVGSVELRDPCSVLVQA